jgi:hypothetical protein
MDKFRRRWLIFLLLSLAACEAATSPIEELEMAEEAVEFSEEAESDQPIAESQPQIVAITPTVIQPEATTPPLKPIQTKWDLWSSGETQLRGANIWQAVVVPELDGPDFKGSGPVGPPYTQEDFNRLAALGANYVTISGPGLFTETPPFEPDPDVVAYMDELIAKISAADLFVTIAFRTGPGRSEFGLCCGGDPYFDGYFNDSVWEDPVAQNAWAKMWRYTADRYKDHPNVVGFKLMVEPNADEIFFGVYEPYEFYPENLGTSYDWNQWYPQIVDSIRSVDSQTPILVGGMGYSAVRWLPYLMPYDDPYIVYVAHQYAPYDEYTHQGPGGKNEYPGSIDLDYDGDLDQFNRDWLETLTAPLGRYAANNKAPVAVDEFGINRWVPGGAAYVDDLISLFEQRGINHSLWEWQTSWSDFRMEVHSMDFRLGPDPGSRSETENDLQNTITKYWARNTIRPSNAPWSASVLQTDSTPTAAPPQPALIETESFRGAIFTAEQIGASKYWPRNDDPWTPSEADIFTLEEQLPGFLEEPYPNLWQQLERYTRQYWGTVTPEGNRAIYVNFLCDAERMSSYIDWRTDRVEVMDGGDCYFQTLYDVEDGTFVWLAINGVS